MDKFTPTHVHKETGEKFDQCQMMLEHESAYDETRERRVFLAGTLAPIQPIEEWEPVPNYDVGTKYDKGLLHVALHNRAWVELPHPDVRLVDGCRLERRKA